MNWVSPVALQPSNDLAADDDGLRASTPDDEHPLHEQEHGHAHQHAPGHGLLSELVLTAMVVLGVALTTLAALYTAGAFRPPVHHPLPSSAASR